ncbi:hypothetical protein NTGM5_870005 [Candidatus Nitrotoga sp. M5]|nr:hypothetical protein NTGM5_870005 [Candidatus Nitrotoga sp. M5]
MQTIRFPLKYGQALPWSKQHGPINGGLTHVSAKKWKYRTHKYTLETISYKLLINYSKAILATILLQNK